MKKIDDEILLNSIMTTANMCILYEIAQKYAKVIPKFISILKGFFLLDYKESMNIFYLFFSILKVQL